MIASSSIIARLAIRSHRRQGLTRQYNETVPQNVIDRAYERDSASANPSGRQF